MKIAGMFETEAAKAKDSTTSQLKSGKEAQQKRSKSINARSRPTTAHNPYTHSLKSNPFSTAALEDEIRRDIIHNNEKLKRRYVRERYKGKFPGKLITENPY
jgi:HEPN domain-containing protein